MDSHTHSSWVLLRDGEEEGVTCLQQEIRQSLLPSQIAALPTVLAQESPRTNGGVPQAKQHYLQDGKET